MNLITRQEVAAITGYSMSHLASKKGQKLFPVRSRIATGRVFYDKDEVLEILEKLKAERKAESWIKDPLFS